MAIICVLFLAMTFAVTDSLHLEAQEQGTEKPNIVLIIADDMRQDDLEHMPRTKSLISDQGMTFSNAFTTLALCCPSRSTMLRGQYPHNHGVKDNGPPDGGFQAFRSPGPESSTVATWLQGGGYETVLIGKYLNGYPLEDQKTYIPPGWDEWYGKSGGAYYNYTLNENGTRVSYRSNEQDYSTDVLAGKARDYVRRAARDPAPFFMYLAPSTPHEPYTPAPRHQGTTPTDVRVPRHGKQFNEQNVDDKPGWVRRLPRLTAGQVNELDEKYRLRLDMLLAADEMVADLVDELEATGELDNTYIVFTSDNGLHMGEHRVKEAKRTPYEESIRPPLTIRGPGITPGRTTAQFALNTDFAPTFAELGGVSTPSFVDGRSLKPLFKTNAPGWRTAFLVESWDGSSNGTKIPEYNTVRTAKHKYTHYPATKENELYNLANDPYETQSIRGSAGLKSRLGALRACAGESCRTAEDGP